MKTSRIVLLAAGLLLVGAVVLKETLGQNAAAPIPRVGVCDMTELFNNYQKAKDLTTQQDERLRKLKDEHDARMKKIDGIKLRMEGLKKDSAQYETELNNLQKETIDLTSWGDFQKQLILREHFRLTKEMYSEVLQAVKKVAEENDVQLVLDRKSATFNAESTEELLRQIEGRKVLYCNDDLDLTAKALTRLNSAYRAVKPATQP